jgi:hypothetical protein
METLKDPAMLLSVANSIGIVGSIAYFYKQQEAQRLEMVKISQTLTVLLKKMAEFEKNDQHKSETIHALSEQIKRFNDQIDRMPTLDHINNIDDQIERMPTFDDINNVDIDLTEIIEVLAQKDIKIERPSLSYRARRSGDRRDPPRREPEYDRSERGSARSDRSRTDTSRDFDSRPQSGRNTRSYPQNRQQQQTPRQVPRQTPGPRQEVKHETHHEYDDDMDLIGEVRRQTHC